MPTELLLIAAGLWAGAQNALAGGGSFVTLPALILAGLDPRAATITSPSAPLPGQVTTGLAGRSPGAGTEKAGCAAPFAVRLLRGPVGRVLLPATATPPH